MNQGRSGEGSGDGCADASTSGHRVRSFLGRHERAAILAVLVAGLAERVVWVAQAGRLQPFHHEMQKVAVSFATTGVLGDAYYPGQGPTAHVGPVMPIIGGLIYRALGVGSLTSEIVLTGLALTFLGVTLLAFYAAFRRLGLPVEWRLAALTLAALVPLNLKFEVQSLRLFEGALAVALLACGLLLTLRLDARPDLRARDYVVPAVLCGLLALLNPPTALAAYAALGILTLKRVPARRWIGVGLVMAIGLAAFMGPWAIRNERVLGRMILTRSNYPLEHAIGFHEGAVSPSDPRAVFETRLRSMHPYSSEPASSARDELARVGEIAFMDRREAETRAWERANPGGAARIAARHFMEFWLPPRWMWRIYNDHAELVVQRQAYVWTVTIAAFSALVWGLFRAPLGPRLYVACILVIPSLPYVLVQPVQRYRYLVAVLTVFLAMEFAFLACQAISRRLAAR
jgi:hypothetical protein